MDQIGKGDQSISGPSGGTHEQTMTKGGIRERSPNVAGTTQAAAGIQRPSGLSDVEWQEQQALQRQPTATTVLGADEDDGTPDALLNKAGVEKGFDVGGLGNAST